MAYGTGRMVRFVDRFFRAEVWVWVDRGYYAAGGTFKLMELEAVQAT